MPYRKKFNKKNDIVGWLQYQSDEYDLTHFSMGEIAIGLDYAPSTKFNDVIWELREEGRVQLQPVKYRGGVVEKKWFVCLPEHLANQLSFLDTNCEVKNA